MSEVFRRSAQLLDSDGWRPVHLASGGAVLLILGWGSWFFAARLPVFVVSRTARVEVSSAAYVVAAPVTAEVRQVRASLGQSVTAGDPILELDTDLASLRERERSLMSESNRAVIDQLTRQVAFEELNLIQTRRASEAASAEAAKRFSESDEQARVAEEEGRRADELFHRGLMSASERSRIVSEGSRRRITAEALRDASARAVTEAKIAYTTKQTDVAKLRASLASAEGNLSSSLIGARSSAREVATRTVKAPISGRIAEDINLRAGSVVHVGDRVTSIVPDGQLIIVAEFNAGSAVGRIRTGLPARFIADAYPSVEYGAISARVKRIAAEARNGVVRVELEITRVPRGITLQHAVTGRVEVETEHLAPATLLLRAAGRVVT